MIMNYLWTFYELESGLIQVAIFAVCVVENRVKSGVQKLFRGLNRGQDSVYLGTEKAIWRIKSWGFMNVHFSEYLLLKVKKVNSLYVIIRKK